jgi:AcrR family transcriptional regulator
VGTSDTTGGRSASPPDPEDGVRPPSEDLRARRRRLVQDDIARIAVRLFLKRGYDNVSVEELATAAGMSERSFFRYFATKDEVLRRYRRGLFGALVQTFEARSAEEPALEALRNAYVQTSHVEVADRPRIHALARLLADAGDVWAKDMGETITDASVVAELSRRMALPPEELRPAVLAAAVSAAVVTGWNLWVRSSGEEDPGEIVAASIDILGLIG